VPAFDSVDVDDPPVFESQASYLLRLGLLDASERRRLTAADFAPERAALGQNRGASRRG
jgi:hypothetical protein